MDHMDYTPHIFTLKKENVQHYVDFKGLFTRLLCVNVTFDCT